MSEVCEEGSAHRAIDNFHERHPSWLESFAALKETCKREMTIVRVDGKGGSRRRRRLDGETRPAAAGWNIDLKFKCGDNLVQVGVHTKKSKTLVLTLIVKM
jgi:hypothetical protein